MQLTLSRACPRCALILLLLLFSVYAPAQQVADDEFKPALESLAFTGAGPIVLYDEAHHTSTKVNPALASTAGVDFRLPHLSLAPILR